MIQLALLQVTPTFKYSILLVILYFAEIAYFKIATKLNIIDVPNRRSSHKKNTLIGGGIVFWISIFLSFIYNNDIEAYWLLLGVTLIAIISFWDDVKHLNAYLRLSVHFASVLCAFLAFNIFNILPLWAIVISFITFVAIINIYNFMDGINGITGLYTLAILGSLQYTNIYIVRFVHPELIWYPMVASLVFLFFNFRNKARCFSGDVGSISMGFWIGALLLALILKTKSIIWLGFLMVYGIDSIGTILHRIYLGDNIMIAHRIHLFQILANEKGIPQRVISFFYFMIQLVISALIIAFYPSIGWYIFIGIALLLTSIYLIKFKLMKKFGLRVRRSDSKIITHAKPIKANDTPIIAQ